MDIVSDRMQPVRSSLCDRNLGLQGSLAYAARLPYNFKLISRVLLDIDDGREEMEKVRKIYN